MTTTRLFILVALFALIFPAMASAKTITHPTGKLEFEVPDDWQDAQEDDVLVVATQEEGVFFLFWAVPPESVEEGAKALLDKLGEVSTNVEANGDPQELEVNGIQALTLVGTATVEDVPIVWTGAVLVANPEKPVIMAAVVDLNQWEKYEKAVGDLLNSIRPIKAEAKKEAPATPAIPKIGK